MNKTWNTWQIFR